MFVFFKKINTFWLNFFEKHNDRENNEWMDSKDSRYRMYKQQIKNIELVIKITDQVRPVQFNLFTMCQLF